MLIVVMLIFSKAVFNSLMVFTFSDFVGSTTLTHSLSSHLYVPVVIVLLLNVALVPDPLITNLDRSFIPCTLVNIAGPVTFNIEPYPFSAST